MTKADLVESLCSNIDWLSKKQSSEVVEAVIDTMKDTLGRGENIKISGFGNFVVRDKRQRMGRNPQTGEPIVIGARRVLSFKASEVLRGLLNTRLSPETTDHQLPG